jgi:mannose-6-phosphate isomerase-like protein (cupin superfamily)
MSYMPINFREKLGKFSERWSPKIIAKMNDYHFKLVRSQGEFPWHSHPDTDEVFVIIEGRMRIELRDGAVELKEGEMFVVPRGIEHRPVAEQECQLLLIEPAGTVNTGDANNQAITSTGDWI